MREPDRLQEYCGGGGVWCVGNLLLPLRIEKFHHSFNSERAGNLAGGVPAHTIRHHQDLSFGGDEERVFVVIPQPADVGDGAQTRR